MGATLTKTLFIDFDGTYADHGVVPPAHEQALAAVRANGHRAFLCTGRPKSMVPVNVLENHFDGLVGAAGGYVELDGQVLADVRFPAELGARLVRLLDEHDALYVLEAPEAGYVRAGTETAISELLGTTLRTDEGPRDILANVVAVADPATKRFGKVTCFGARTSLADLVEQLGDSVALIPSSLPELGAGAGEMYLPHIDKSVGLEVVRAHLGLALADVVAIGDGHNDVEMVEHAGVGIAVASGPPELLGVADFTIPGPTEGGLVEAFATLGLV